MKSVGVRELQQNAGRVLRGIVRGGSVEVTDRGRPVAWLVSTAKGDALELLEHSGRLVRAGGDLLALGEPLRMAKGKPTPSECLAGMRQNER